MLIIVGHWDELQTIETEVNKTLSALSSVHIMCNVINSELSILDLEIFSEVFQKPTGRKISHKLLSKKDLSAIFS